MKLCYCDETGTGQEPIAIMVGVIVDAQRMHVTKHHWKGLLATLSEICGHQLVEIHTRDFYSGSGVWRDMKGADRSRVISAVFNWLKERRHDVVYSAVLKQSYYSACQVGKIPGELKTLWRFLGFHLILAVQKAHKAFEKTKGNTIFVFDNENREEARFTELILSPPAWSGSYYGLTEKEEPLDQVIDVPYFGDSREVVLIQVADFVAFFLRRYAEISEGFTPPRYKDEMPKVEGWIRLLAERSIGRSAIYPTRARCPVAKMFYEMAPRSIREL